MNNLIIFDLDGTLCDITHRLHFINPEKPNKKDWPSFFRHCEFDKPKENIVILMHMLQMFCDIKFFSGRSDIVRDETLRWLNKNLQLVSTPNLTMRKDGDYRVDHVVKKEMYDNLPEEDKQRLICTFDDRDQVVNMWRNIGVTCCQVAPGDF